MISTANVIGKWKNSRPDTQGIESFELRADNGSLKLSVYGVSGGFMTDNLTDLECTAHATSPESNTFSGFQAQGTENGKEYFFAGNINKGLIIIATYIKVLSGNESNYFVREFFYKLK